VNKVFFEKHSGCKYCQAPAAFCQRWTKEPWSYKASGIRQCNLDGIIEAFYYLWCHFGAEYQERVLGEAGVDPSDRHAVGAHLGAKATLKRGTWEVTNLILHLEDMVSLLEAEFGAVDTWGYTTLQKGLPRSRT
jgi:hypothetical protein